MNKGLKYFITILAIIICLLILYFAFIPSGRRVFNTYMRSLNVADDTTLYSTRKDVEDTCRSMQTSYESDKLMWLQFKDSEDSERKNWADQALIRANKTASEYNNYILKNKYVWRDNIPSDIYMRMEYLGVDGVDE